MKRQVFAMVICLSVGLAALPLSAQDSDNIQTFEDLVTVRGFLGFNLPSVNIVHEYGNVLKEVIYQPNPSAGGYYGVGIGWNGLGISLVNDIPPGDDDVERYGESSFENLSMFLYGRQYGIDLYYQRYKGCYMSNPGDFGLHEGDPETIRPDLSLSAVGLNAYYVFSGNFSLVASFSQTERQLGSGGSFLFMVSAMRLVIDSDAPLFPAAHDGGGYAGFRGGRFYSLATSPGYAYSLVYGDCISRSGCSLEGDSCTRNWMFPPGKRATMAL